MKTMLIEILQICFPRSKSLRKGIDFECSLKNFDRGEIPERELAELFLDLLERSDAAIERNKKREKQPRIILSEWPNKKRTDY